MWAFGQSWGHKPQQCNLPRQMVPSLHKSSTNCEFSTSTSYFLLLLGFTYMACCAALDAWCALYLWLRTNALTMQLTFINHTQFFRSKNCHPYLSVNTINNKNQRFWASTHHDHWLGTPVQRNRPLTEHVFLFRLSLFTRTQQCRITPTGMNHHLAS